MKPWNFTVEETNLDCNLLLQQPVRVAGEASSSPVAFDLEPVRQRCLRKVEALTDAEFASLTFELVAW